MVYAYALWALTNMKWGTPKLRKSLWQQHEPISTYVNISSEKEFYLETDHKPLVLSPELLALPKYREVLYTESYQKNLTNYAVVEVHCMLTWYASHWWCMQSAVAIQCSSGYNVSRENFLIYLFVGQTFKNTSNIWVKFELCIYSQCECYVVDCNKQSEWLLEHHDWPLHEWGCTCSLQCW